MVKMNKMGIWKLFVLCTVLMLGYAGSAMAKEKVSNEALFGYMSPFEDMTEFALDKDIAEIDENLPEIIKIARELEEVVDAATSAEFNKLTKAIYDARKSKNFGLIALNATDAYKLLVDKLDEKKLEVPKEVAVLDYVGFKIHALLFQKNIDWELVRKAVHQGYNQWAMLKNKVSDKALRDTMDSTISGMVIASQIKHPDMMRFAAQIDLDLVDMLEDYFEKK